MQMEALVVRVPKVVKDAMGKVVADDPILLSTSDLVRRALYRELLGSNLPLGTKRRIEKQIAEKVIGSSSHGRTRGPL